MAQLNASSVFASGTDGELQPDLITVGDNSLWAEYGNGADLTGASGSSTIVRYSLSGDVEQTFTVAGSADGLKVDPTTGTVYVYCKIRTATRPCRSSIQTPTKSANRFPTR